MGQVASSIKKMKRRNRRRKQPQEQRTSTRNVEHTLPVVEEHPLSTLMVLRAAHPFLSIQQVANVVAARSNLSADTTAMCLGMMGEQSMPLLYSLARSWAWGAVAYRCQTHPGEASAVDYLGDNALHWAAFGRPPVETVMHLLRADPTLAQVANKKGHCPLHTACSYKASPSVLKAILQAYPTAAQTLTNAGSYPLHLLCDFGGSLENLRVLLEAPEARATARAIDRIYHRRPLQIWNARKNRAEFQQALQIMRRARQRQGALWRDIDRGMLDETEVEDDLVMLEDTVQAYQCMDFWRKPAVLLYVEHTGEAPLTRPNTEDENEEDILVVSGPEIFIASIANPHCPEVLQEFSVLLHYPLLMEPLDDRGNLPLHIAARSGNRSVITELVNANSNAAAVRNRDGAFPLIVWLQRSNGENKQVPWRLLEAYPEALIDLDLDRRYYPFLWSQFASRSPDALFHSLRSQPNLVQGVQRMTRFEI